MATPVGPNCIIESDFGNLEAVLFADGQLHHMFSSATIWHPAQTLPSLASGPGSIIQSDFGSGNHKNFEVVLWSGTELVHWWHDNSDVTLPWQRGQTISTNATGPGSIMQSDFGSGGHGNFEVVVLEGTNLVHWWHDNSDVTLPWQRGQTITTTATGPGSIIRSIFGGDHKNFEVVVLEGHELVHWWHDNSDVTLPWQRGQTITTTATGPGSIIRSIFGGDHKNFEVVVLEGHELVHRWHDNSDVTLPWERGQTISVASTGPGCIVETSFAQNSPGNNFGPPSFQVLTAELTRSVVHYWHHNSDVTLPWWRYGGGLPNFGEIPVDSPNMHQTTKVAQLTGEFDRQTNMPTLSQTTSRFGVVGCDLGQSFEHNGGAFFLFGDTNVDDNIRSDPSSALDSIGFTSDTNPSNGIRIDLNRSYPKVCGISQGAFCVPADGVSIDPGVSGPGWLIQAKFASSGHRDFEVVMLQGNELVHWWHDNSDVTLPWQRGLTITMGATGPGCIIQSDFGSSDFKNFEVIVLEGNNLVHWWYDNSTAWQRGQTITSSATGPGCIIQSDFGNGEHGNFEVIVLEGKNLVHWWHDNSDVNLPWQRGQIITTTATGPGYIIQSDFGSGEHGNFEVVALEGNNLVHWWHDNSDVNLPWQRGQTITTNATGPGCIIQSDFGSSNHKNFEVVVLEGNELVHYWHDNSDVNLPWQRGQTITSSATGPSCIIQSDFGSGGHGNFEVLVLEGSDLVHEWHNNSDVNLPWQLGQTISKGLMFVFFTTDARVDDPFGSTMGRSVLARSGDDGLNFGTYLYKFSRDKFINISLQLVDNKDFPGLPDPDGKGLLVWGSGGYRRSNVYLAYISVEKILDRSAYLFFAGRVRHRPHWSKNESEAVPLFLSGSVGELCVRWNQVINRFVLLYNGDNPGGIIEHQSLTPWGPWTTGENIFDFPAAFKHFIHVANSNDGLSDPDRDDITGGTYGPYMISRYTKPREDGASIMFFVISVWNPYNTMLMTAVIRQR
jgi:hypothetical protein